MPIYLDYHAHAPIDPRVLDVLVSAYGAFDANPHSTHLHGVDAHIAVERARASIAALIQARPSEIIFTSGATESNNLAFFGLDPLLSAGGRTRIAVGSLEHPSVLQAARALEKKGYQIDILPAGRDGRIDLDAVRERVTGTTGLVSVAAANHEIGTLQPISEIAAIAHSHGALMHSDLAQIAGRLPVACSQLDLASLSSHKLGGPSGIGALYVKRLIKPKLQAHLIGGGQEAGLRSGTLPVPLCVAFGEACAIGYREMDEDAARIGKLRDGLLNVLLAIPGADLNGSRDHRLPGNINIRFEDVDGEALAFYLQNKVSISTGSACSAKSLEPSPVLLAIGLSRPEAETAVRIGLGRLTAAEDVAQAASAIAAAVVDLRATRRRA